MKSRFEHEFKRERVANLNHVRGGGIVERERLQRLFDDFAIDIEMNGILTVCGVRAVSAFM